MIKKSVFVITMLLSVSLAGCLDDSSSDSSASTVDSEVILLDVVNDCTNLEIYLQSMLLSNGSTVDTIIGVNATLYHAVYSTATSNLTFEYDLDLDGAGDVYNNISRGTTNLFVPISHFTNLSASTFMTTIVATAHSDNGHISELIHIANDCSILSGVDLGQLSIVVGDFSMYDFEVNSAGTTHSTASGEALVYVSLDAGDDLSWSTVIVQMKADGGVYVECTNPDKVAGTGCDITDNDDGKWAFGEEVTISEGSDDICSGGGPPGNGTCGVQIKILDRSTNKLIYESNTINA
jgi:hypothetical protein